MLDRYSHRYTGQASPGGSRQHLTRFSSLETSRTRTRILRLQLCCLIDLGVSTAGSTSGFLCPIELADSNVRMSNGDPQVEVKVTQLEMKETYGSKAGDRHRELGSTALQVSWKLTSLSKLGCYGLGSLATSKPLVLGRQGVLLLVNLGPSVLSCSVTLEPRSLSRS